MREFSDDSVRAGREKSNAAYQRTVLTQCATKSPCPDMPRLHEGAEMITAAERNPANESWPLQTDPSSTKWRCMMKTNRAVVAGIVAGVSLAVATFTYA